MSLRRSLAGVTVGLLLVVAGAVAWESRSLPDASAIRERVAARSAAAERFTWAPLEAISPRLQTAVVVWEDPAFYHHGGISTGGIRRAFLQNLRAGRYVRGGSTITQQVAKNLFLGPEKTLRRKLKEVMLAWQLERTLSKDQILEIYLNIAEWGDGMIGAEAACRFYFRKSSADLTWAEAALLTGILPNPHRFNPLQAPEEALRLRQAVLVKLLAHGQVTAEEYGEAASTPWRGILPAPSVEGTLGKGRWVSDVFFTHRR